ncbi:MAG: SRPBCC family protein [Gemmatimonadaceae bacterium]
MHMATNRIEKQILLNAPLARVWRAISESKEFGSWFGVKFDGPFAPGAHMRGVIVPTTVDPEVAKSQEPYTGMPFEITIEKIDPERTFSFRWHPFAIDPKVDYSAEPTTLVTFTLEEVNGGVKLTVTESGFDKIPLARRAQAFTMNDIGWAKQMELIAEYVGREG